MRIFAIGDLHLPGGDDKPMDVFGVHWEGHFEKIAADWQARVQEEDLVLLPGDISWAMQLEQALPDLEVIGALPGRKLLIRGNHDYWWSSLSKVRAALPQGMQALQNDAFSLGGAIICGTRGWALPGEEGSSDQDLRIYRRELLRMELSLQDGRKKAPSAYCIVMVHYPPFNERQEPSEFTEIFQAYGVQEVVYGHLHGHGLKGAFTGVLDGIYYHQVSCDGLGFALKEMEYRENGGVLPTP